MFDGERGEMCIAGEVAGDACPEQQLPQHFTIVRCRMDGVGARLIKPMSEAKGTSYNRCNSLDV